MISVEDLNGTVHSVCPRCGGEWQNSANGIECINFNNVEDSESYCMAAVSGVSLPEGQSILVAPLKIKDDLYMIEWHSDKCVINRKVNGKWVNSQIGEGDQLPILPYDISGDKLKIYLLFS